MKLDEAIKELTECMTETEKILYPESFEAHDLGIEAMKYRQQEKKDGYLDQDDLLPGETQ